MENGINDSDTAAVAAGLKLLHKANATIERRRWTDRPGGDWTVPTDDYSPFTQHPQYCGAHGKAVLFYSEDGTAYQVCIFSYAGKELHRVTRKGLDAALRVGQRLADGGE
jgi:hypothetical protein